LQLVTVGLAQRKDLAVRDRERAAPHGIPEGSSDWSLPRLTSCVVNAIDALLCAGATALSAKVRFFETADRE
jgi:hypothetical protein